MNNLYKRLATKDDGIGIALSWDGIVVGTRREREREREQ